MSDVTLTEFLLARIAEDEAAARLCEEMFPTPWEVSDRGWRVRIYSSPIPDLGDHAELGDDRVPVVMEVEPDRNLDDPRWLSERVEHVRRHDPSRVRTECEAKRRIVTIVENATGGEKTYLERLQHTDVEDAQYLGSRAILGCLALPYADHPDFREEWRP